MTTARQRRKTKNPLQKVRQPVRPVKESTVTLDSTLSKHWNKAKTINANFEKIGLLNKLNKDVNKRETCRRLATWNWRRLELAQKGQTTAFDSEEEIFMEMEEIFANDSKVFSESLKIGAQDLENAAIEAHLQKIKIHPEGAKRPLSEDELLYIKALIAKHGHGNYKKMFRDISTNYNQLTGKQLEKLVQRM